MRYLYPRIGVYIVKGATRAAIYDTVGGNVYSINMDAVSVIEMLAGGDNDAYCSFAQQVIDMDLYQWVDDAYNIDVLYPPELPAYTSDTRLQFFWAEITGRCNLKCVHCYAESGETSFPEELPTEKWKAIILESFESGARSMQFIGGEPLVRQDIKELVEFASQIGFQEIEIFSNGTLVLPDFLDWAKTIPGIRFAISLYSNEPDVHDVVTKTPGSWQKTFSAIDAIQSRGIPIRVALIVMRQNEHTLETTLSFCQEKAIPCRTPDVVRPTGRGSSDILPTRSNLLRSRMRTEPNFHTSTVSFNIARLKNTCWANKLAIAPNGDILPCIFARDIHLGSLRINSLQEIMLRETFQQIWHLNRDKINVCRMCEYRYACKDCRPLAVKELSNLQDKETYCTYDPQTGQWL